MPKNITFSKNVATTMQIQEWAVMKMKTGIMMMRVIGATAVLADLAVIVAMVIQPTVAIRAATMMTAVASTLVVLSMAVSAIVAMMAVTAAVSAVSVSTLSAVVAVAAAEVILVKTATVAGMFFQLKIIIFFIVFEENIYF